MTLKTAAMAILFGITGITCVSCASSTASIPVREMPTGATFTGLWYTNFGDMKVTQKADGTAFGTFDFKTGGTVQGKVEGGVFAFDWVQNGDFQVGRREVSGRGYLVISNDGLSVNGKWGYGENYLGGGDWTGNKATEIYN